MASYGNFWSGMYSPVGSASDVSMLNQGDYSNWLNRLLGQNTFSWNAFTDAASNYNNLISKMLGGQGQFGNLNDTNAMANQFLGQQSNLAKLANENVSSALSDVYSTGRSQAQAAGADARRQAADQLASAGLLRSGGAVQAMTDATATPILNMETQLANTRAQAYENALSNLQQGYGNSLQSGYNTALGSANLQSSSLGNLLNALGSMASGTGNNATSLTQPTYYQPSYQKNTGLLDALLGGASVLGSLGGLESTGLSANAIGTSLASLLPLLGFLG